MSIKAFFNYKDQFMEDILTNPRIVDLITEGNPPDDPRDLVYRQVFPYEHIPEAVEHGQTFICVDVDLTKSHDSTYIYPVIYVWVFTHKSLMSISTGGVRVDEICSEIDEQIKGSYEYGMGKLDLYSSRRFAPMTGYQGKCLMFQAKDWNMPPADKNKTIPTRRGRT